MGRGVFGFRTAEASLVVDSSTLTDLGEHAASASGAASARKDIERYDIERLCFWCSASRSSV